MRYVKQQQHILYVNKRKKNGYPIDWYINITFTVANTLPAYITIVFWISDLNYIFFFIVDCIGCLYFKCKDKARGRDRDTNKKRREKRKTFKSKSYKHINKLAIHFLHTEVLIHTNTCSNHVQAITSKQARRWERPSEIALFHSKKK